MLRNFLAQILKNLRWKEVILPNTTKHQRISIKVRLSLHTDVKIHWNKIGQCILIKAFQHLQSEMLRFFLAQILQNRVVLPNTTHNLLRSVRVRFLFYSRSLEWELTVYIGKSFSRSTIWDVAQLSSSNILEVMIERRNFPKKPPTHTLGTGGGGGGV